MSTNLHVYGVREIFVPSINKTDEQTISLDLWQTPTDITREIMNKDDKLQGYIDWVMKESEDYWIPIDDEFYDESYYRNLPNYDKDKKALKYNNAKEEVKRIKNFINFCQKNGYDVIFYMM